MNYTFCIVCISITAMSASGAAKKRPCASSFQAIEVIEKRAVIVLHTIKFHLDHVKLFSGKYATK